MCIPPSLYNEKNEIRKVGFEIEFAGLELQSAAHMITSVFGGEIKKLNNYYYDIRGTELGDFVIKIDSSFLYDKKYLSLLNKLGINIQNMDDDLLDQDRLEDILKRVAGIIIPYELVTPPVNINEISVFDELTIQMRLMGAKGTGSSVVYAFATHINAEAPSLSSTSVTSHLRSFLLLYSWLLDELKIDTTRKLTPFINPFSGEYTELVLSEDYNPDMNQLCKDYIHHNKARNRPLDLYPLFAYLKPEIQKLEKTGNVSPRPTYHYRLPNSDIDRKKWGLQTDWYYWVIVEKLANDLPLQDKLRAEFRNIQKIHRLGSESHWKKFLRNHAEFNKLIS
jgi:hypothetical protein